jgi:hypothetical protein
MSRALPVEDNTVRQGLPDHAHHVTILISDPPSLSYTSSHDVASIMCQGMADNARHVILHISDPRFQRVERHHMTRRALSTRP